VDIEKEKRSDIIWEKSAREMWAEWTSLRRKLEAQVRGLYLLVVRKELVVDLFGGGGVRGVPAKGTSDRGGNQGEDNQGEGIQGMGAHGLV